MMDKEVKAALAGISRTWKLLLTAKDRETYDFWVEEQLRLHKILYGERNRVLSRLHGKPYKKHAGPGRPSKSLAAKQLRRQKYQHEYYLRVTKQKRAERRNNEAQE